MNIFTLVVENKEFVGIFSSFISLVIPFSIFIVNKSKEIEQINFERFHAILTSGLSNQDSKTGLDQQVAIIFEMRHYPKYYPVIRRILKAQISRWELELKSKPHFTQLITEARKTIEYSQQKKLTRWYKKDF